MNMKKTVLYITVSLLFWGCQKEYEEKIIPGKWSVQGSFYKPEKLNEIEKDDFVDISNSNLWIYFNANFTGESSADFGAIAETFHWMVDKDNEYLVIDQIDTRAYQILKASKKELQLRYTFPSENVYYHYMVLKK